MPLKHLTVEHLSTEELIRIFSKIKIHPEVAWRGTPCWIWQASLGHGYGRVWLRDHVESVHRIMFAWLVHRLPSGKKYGELDHLCRRRACANPIHLEFVSQHVNLARGNGCAARNARKTHCNNGHLLAGDNIYTTPNKPAHYRRCKQCFRDRYNRLKLDPVWRAREWEKCRIRGQKNRLKQSGPPTLHSGR